MSKANPGLQDLEATCNMVGGKSFTVKPTDGGNEGSFICATREGDPKQDPYFEITSDGKFIDGCDAQTPPTRSPGRSPSTPKSEFDAPTKGRAGR